MASKPMVAYFTAHTLIWFAQVQTQSLDLYDARVCIMQGTFTTVERPVFILHLCSLDMITSL